MELKVGDKVYMREGSTIFNNDGVISGTIAELDYSDNVHKIVNLKFNKDIRVVKEDMWWWIAETDFISTTKTYSVWN